MRAVGNVVAGPVVAGPGPNLPTGRPDVDRDAMRERREAERARRAAANPFARLGPTPSKSEARAVGARLVSPEYEAAAFTTPPPSPDPTPTRTAEVQPVPASKPEAETSRDVRARQVVELYSGPEQLTLREIAARLDCSPATVTAVLKSAGVERRPAGRRRRLTPSQLADRVVARPAAAPAPDPRPSVRRVRTLGGELGRGFLWTCPAHRLVLVEQYRTFADAVTGLGKHIRKDHTEEDPA